MTAHESVGPEKPTVGDKVRVFDVNGRHMGQPAGGWPGEVTKVGRTVVYITYGARRDPQPFSIANRRSNDRYRHKSWRTVAEVEAQDRRDAAMEALRSVGLEARRGHQIDADIGALEELAAHAVRLLGPRVRIEGVAP